MISRDDYTVRLVDDLPASVGGFVTESPDGHLNIYLNARHSWHGQRRSFRHELRHAEEDDLHSDEPLAVIEARASQKPSPLGKVAPEGSDEVPARLASIPHLMRARDLLPAPAGYHPQRTVRAGPGILSKLKIAPAQEPPSGQGLSTPNDQERKGVPVL